MSITDELRDWMRARGMMAKETFDQLTAIADRIDREHRMAMEKVAAEADALPMTDESMAEHGWVRGPLDADGKIWRNGDMSDSNWGVIEGIAYEDGRWLISGHDMSAPWVPADSIRHYHAPTVEDVLREFGDWYAHVKGGCDEDGIIAEYAARLRLAGEVDA